MTKNSLKWVLIALFLLLSGMGTGFAEEIVFQVNTSMEVDTSTIYVSIEISNTGDADALWVQPAIHLGKIQTDLDKRPYIAFGGSSRWRYQCSRNEAGLEKPGVYPLLVWVRYHDAQMYPFSIPVATLARVNSPDRLPDISGSLTISDIENSGTSRLTLHNLKSNPWSGMCRLVLTEELKAVPGTIAIDIEEGDEQSVDFQIMNQSARKGSIYNVYAILEGEATDLRETIIFSGQARITADGGQGQGIPRKMVAGVFMLIGGLFCVALAMEWKTPR